MSGGALAGIRVIDLTTVVVGPTATLYLEDEHLADAGFFRKVDHPVEGRIVDMKFPNRFSAGGREDYRPPPVLGGDSVAILREIGYGSDEIDEMLKSKVTIDGRRN